jgi:solute carrier family 36 (proton-coupled amino acid transporter)
MCDLAIFMSQTSFVIAAIYFIASQTLRLIDFLRIEQGLVPFGESYKWVSLPIIFSIIMPMLAVHKPQKFAKAHFFADCVILFTLAVILYFAAQSVQANGWLSQSLPLVDTSMWPNVFGFAVFTFEGVGIVLPIQDMTANKQNYFRVVCITVSAIGFAYVAFSEFCLYAWHDRFRADAPLIFEYLPRDNILCQGLVLIYNVNMVISYVLVSYPANKVLDRLFLSEMKSGPEKRAYKNVLRCSLLLVVIVIALTVWDKLNTLLAIAGSLTCTPIAFILPPMFHYKVCAQTKRQKLIDAGLVCFGLIVMVFCTAFAILTW